jgi:hypothetical protein
MSKIRTTSQLQELLDHEFAWRLKEIHDIRSAARKADSSAQRTFMRAGVALLYAHWEGFVKAGAEGYVNHLSCKGLRYSELKSCFVALGLKVHLHRIGSSDKSDAGVTAIEFIMNKLDAPADLPLRNAIDTESNLSSTVFQNIVGWIGIDSERYATRFNLLDESLLKRRNRIAHGQHLELDPAAFSQLVDQVLELLRWFKTDLENAMATKAFMKTVG